MTIARPNRACASLRPIFFGCQSAEPRLHAPSYRHRHKQKYAAAPGAQVCDANEADFGLITSVMAEDLI